MVSMKNLLWGTGKVVVMYSGFFVLEGFLSMVKKGVLGTVLVKE